MNRPYKLRYLPLFWEDLSQAASYIAFDLNNPAAANRLVDNAEAGILEHLKNPTMSPTYPSTRRRLHPYYRFYVVNYMVFMSSSTTLWKSADCYIRDEILSRLSGRLLSAKERRKFDTGLLTLLDVVDADPAQKIYRYRKVPDRRGRI